MERGIYKYLFVLTLLAMLAVLAATADATCRWQVSARIEGERPGFGNFAGRVWPVQNIEVRVQARTNGGLWNTPNWPATRTSATGEFSVTSAIVFLDPHCQMNREFRVQIRNLDTGNQWREIHRQTVPGPNGMTGPLAPAPVHSSVIGDVVCDDESCEAGIIRVRGLTEPPMDLRPGGDGNDDANNNNDGNNDDDGDSRQPQIERAPCGIRQAPFVEGVEFRFGQMPADPGPLSSDQALRVETRPNGGGDMTLNRVRQHFRIENAGARDYRSNPRCPSEVHVRFNEGPGRRGEGDAAWSTPYSADIPDIAANATADMAMDGNLWGAGDDLAGEWDEDWEYMLIEVSLDANHAVVEMAEGDNRIVHCYHAPQNVFVAMALCQL